MPGEIVQLDWWHTGIAIPVGKGQTRQAFGLVATLPHSGGHPVGASAADWTLFADRLPNLLEDSGIGEK